MRYRGELGRSDFRSTGRPVVEDYRFRETGSSQAKQWYIDAAGDIETRGAAAWREEWARAEPLPIFAGYPQFDLTPDVADELLPSILRGVGRPPRLRDNPDAGQYTTIITSSRWVV